MFTHDVSQLPEKYLCVLHAAFTMISHRVLPLGRRNVDVLCCHVLGVRRGSLQEAFRSSRVGRLMCHEHKVGVWRLCCVPPVRLMLAVEDIVLLRRSERKLDDGT